MALGRTYRFDVQKERLVTRIGGPAWRRFITDNNISAGYHLCFIMTPPTPRIVVLLFQDGINIRDDEEDSTENDEEEDSMEDDDVEEDSMETNSEDEDPFDSTIFAQRCNLTDIEKVFLMDHLPNAREFTRFPFVTRLTSTNIDRHDMVCFPAYLPFFLHLLFYFYCVGVLSN